MTEQEWVKIGFCAAEIDGGCGPCIESFSKDLLKQFPDMIVESFIEGVKSNEWYSGCFDVEILANALKSDTIRTLR